MKISIDGDMEYEFCGDEAMNSQDVTLKLDTDTYRSEYIALRIEGYTGLPGDHIIQLKRSDLRVLAGFLSMTEE